MGGVLRLVRIWEGRVLISQDMYIVFSFPSPKMSYLLEKKMYQAITAGVCFQTERSLHYVVMALNRMRTGSSSRVNEEDERFAVSRE